MTKRIGLGIHSEPLRAGVPVLPRTARRLEARSVEPGEPTFVRQGKYRPREDGRPPTNGGPPETTAHGDLVVPEGHHDMADDLRHRLVGVQKVNHR